MSVTTRLFRGIYIPTSLVGAEIPAYINRHYRGVQTRNIPFRTKGGSKIQITIPADVTDSASINEIYRNNYKRYMK